MVKDTGGGWAGNRDAATSAAIDAIFAPDATYLLPGSPEPLRGHAGIRQFVTGFRTAPDAGAFDSHRYCRYVDPQLWLGLLRGRSSLI